MPPALFSLLLLILSSGLPPGASVARAAADVASCAPDSGSGAMGDERFATYREEFCERVVIDPPHVFEAEEDRHRRRAFEPFAGPSQHLYVRSLSTE